MRSSFWWILGAVACGGTDLDTDTDVDTDPETDPDTDTDGPRDDEAWARALIDGSVGVDEAMSAVAAGHGWPVHTEADTWLFVAEGAGWSLAGDFNGWTPEPMTDGAGFSWIERSIEAPDGALYKFVHNGEFSADPWARHYFYDEFGEYSLVAPGSMAPRLDRWPEVTDGVVTPRTIRVYVPGGAGPWPVLYMHDGQNLFDPAAKFGYWRLQDAVAATSGILIVGLDNTRSRMSEYTHVDDVAEGTPVTAAGDDYAAFVVDEVKPWIETEYGSTGLDGVLGSSLGGLISLYIADQYPTSFDFAGSMSGTLGWGRFGATNETIGERYAAEGRRAFAIYVDSGGSDGGDGCTDPNGDGFPFDDPTDADNYCANRWFADTMADVGYVWGSDLMHWHEPGAAHNEAAWAARVDKPLAFFLSL